VDPSVLSCIATLIINCTSLPINEVDLRQLEIAKERNRCEIVTGSPCFELFIKKGERNYWVICGEGTKKHRGAERTYCKDAAQ